MEPDAPQERPPYTDEEVKHWLAWLARGMQRHGVSIFRIEQLQPTWLGSQKEMIRYLFLSRMLGGVVVITALFAALTAELVLGGLVRGFEVHPLTLLALPLFGVPSGLFAGLMVAWTDQHRFRDRRYWAVRPPTRAELVGKVLVIALPMLLLILVMGFVINLATLGETYLLTLDQISLLSLLCALLFGGVWGYRNAHQSPVHDIRAAEPLRWSWTDLSASVLRGSMQGGLFLGIMVFFLVLIRSVLALMRGGIEVGELLGNVALGVLGGVLLGGVLGGMLGVVFGGVQQKVIEGETMPHQGMRQALQNAYLGGGGTFLIFSILLGATLAGIWMYGDIGLGLGLNLGGRTVMVWVSMVWVSVTIAAGVWFGGIDVTNHATLCLMLTRAGHIPRRYTAFLDYAADELGILRRVGNGYLFLHRYPMEHLADMIEDAPSDMVNNEAQPPGDGQMAGLQVPASGPAGGDDPFWNETAWDDDPIVVDPDALYWDDEAEQRGWQQEQAWEEDAPDDALRAAQHPPETAQEAHWVSAETTETDETDPESDAGVVPEPSPDVPSSDPDDAHKPPD